MVQDVLVAIIGGFPARPLSHAWSYLHRESSSPASAGNDTPGVTHFRGADSALEVDEHEPEG